MKDKSNSADENGAQPLAGVVRSWKVVYGTAEGPEGRALELLTAELGSIYVRDPGVYTLHVFPCEKSGTGEVSGKPDAILLGTRESNMELRALLAPGEVPEGGYLVRTLDTAAGRRVVLAGDTPAAVIWAVADFLDDGLAALSATFWDGLRYRSHAFHAGTQFAAYESRRAPRTPRRSIFMWAHVADDFRELFRNLARLRFTEVILWNSRPPVNARDVVECAHSWGLSLLWGFAWGWSTDCLAADLAHLERLEGTILADWRAVWRPLGGDGIYFQTFTEVNADDIGGRAVAEAAVRLVNSLSARIRAESPGLRIVFGLHARGVWDSLDEIERTNPSVEILWEDCGGFPFRLVGEFAPEKDAALVDRILATDREVGFVFKGMLLQDWTRFQDQAGPYVLGCASAAVKAEDARMAEELWRPYYADWHRLGRVAHDLARRIQSARPERPAALNAAVNANGEIRFPLALVAELFWNADEPYDALVERVLRKTWVK